MCRFIVYGAGAIGGVVGARLFLSGQDVLLLARGAHHDAIRDEGLRFATPDESHVLRVPVADHPGKAALGPGDVVLLTMKTQDTAAALAELEAVSPPGIVVVCAQNAVENERLALRRFARVYGVCVQLPAGHLEPGAVETYGQGAFDIGRYPAGLDDTAETMAASLRAAGFEATAREDVMPWKYAKLIGNLQNAVEAICGTGDGTDEIVLLARDEGRKVLQAAGIGIAEKVGAEARPDLFQLRPIEGRPRVGGSSLQSLHRGTGTIEADYLNGEIVLLGRAHGVPVPVNDALRRIANRMAREGMSPGFMSQDEFLAAVDRG